MSQELGPRPRVTVAQLRILLEAVENDPSLYNAGKSEMICFLNIEKWRTLTDTLNESPGGALMAVPNWKYVLRYWSENTKKRMKLLDGRTGRRRINPALTPEEAKELEGLEARLFQFMKDEEAREIVDVTYMGKLDGTPGKISENMDEGDRDGVKFAVQLLNVYPARSDENTNPEGPKKRTIIMQGGLAGELSGFKITDPKGVTKRFKCIYNRNKAERPEGQILGNQLNRLQLVSRELQDHISTIQSRIHLIKDMWKHRCGDN